MTAARLGAASAALALVLLAACAPAETAANAADAPTAVSMNTTGPAATQPPAPTTAAVPTAAAVAATVPPTPDIRQPGQLPTDSAGAPIVASVDGESITLDEFQRELARFEIQQSMAADSSALRAAVLNTLIERRLIAHAAAAQGVLVSDEAVEAEYQASAALAGGDEAWRAWLADNRYSEAEFRETLRDTLLTAAMRDLLTEDLGVTLLQVRARHILVPTREQAAALITRLGAGEDFAALAAQYSGDMTTREQGGDLGWFAPEELLEPTLAQIAFTLEPGSVAGPIESSLGFHILQVIEKGERTLSEAKRAELAARRFENWLDTLSASAQIALYI